MGIEIKTIKLLSKILTGIEGKNNILAIGKQDVFATYEDITEILSNDGYEINEDIEILYSKKDHLRKQNYIEDITLFKLLGFSHVDNLDISDYEGPSFFLNDTPFVQNNFKIECYKSLKQ